MKYTKCDRHPERDAVATFRIIEFPAGTRPILFGASAVEGLSKMIDLCEKCANKVRVIKDKDAKN